MAQKIQYTQYQVENLMKREDIISIVFMADRYKLKKC